MSSQTLSSQNNNNFRELLSTAARFWEPRRILYNLILLVGKPVAPCLICLGAQRIRPIVMRSLEQHLK